MGNVLAFVESTGDSLRSNALSNVAFARKAAELHGGDVVLCVIGKGAAQAGADAARYAGKVVVVDDDRLEHCLAETYAPILARLCAEHSASLLCATATAIGKDIIPRTAGLIDAGMASDIAEISGKNQFRRAILAGNAFSNIEIGSDTIAVTVRQSEFDPAEPIGAAGAVVTAEAGDIDPLGAEIVGLDTTASDRPELNDADVVVAGGRGMGNGENFKKLEQLADALGAAMGASRAATDAGYVPADWQVGQTGKIVAPNLYIAVAISEAIQHLAGMKSSKTIVAINKDPEAPIFQISDYGLVAKWEDTLPALVEQIKAIKAAQG